MKKITALSLFLLSNLAFGQTISNQNNSGVTYYPYEKENTQTITGIFVQPPPPPYWARQLIKESNNSRNDESSGTKAKKTESATANKPVENKSLVAAPNVLPNAVNTEKNKPVENTQLSKTEVPAKSQRQVIISKKDIVTNDISVWNRTSQDIIEKKANAKLAKDYQDFLMN